VGVVGAISSAEAVSLTIAALALALGFWNAYRDWALRRVIAGKERQANVTVALDPMTKGRSDQLVLANEGPAAASHLHVLIGGASLLHHAWFRNEREMSGPLGPHAEYRYDVDWQADEPTEVTVTWADGSSEHREYRTTSPPGPPPPTAYYIPS
jgi:hypothetical protein